MFFRFNFPKGKIWSGEFEVRRRDSSQFIAHVIDAPMRDDKKNLVGVIGIFYKYFFLLNNSKGISQDQTAQVKQREELLAYFLFYKFTFTV